MQQYLDLLKDIKDNGTLKPNRTGTDTISVFGRQIRFNLDKEFPLITTKKLYIKGILGELLWFLGNHMKDDRYKDLPMTNIQFLKDNNINIWNEWADKDGNLGPIYGYQWTKWKNSIILEDGSGEGWYDEPINQIDNLINDLKNNPDSRRLMVNAWNVSDLQEMNLMPCHFGFQCYSVKMDLMERYYKFNEYAKMNSLDVTGMSTDDAMKHYNFPTRKLSLNWFQRSNDVPIGSPYNIASYAFLTHMLAQITNHYPGELIGNLGDCHIYVNQMDGINEQLTRTPRQLPRLKLNRKVTSIYDFKFEDFEIINYNPYPIIKMPIAV